MDSPFTRDLLLSLSVKCANQTQLDSEVVAALRQQLSWTHLRELIAIELKLGRFDARDKGQMELYLRWLIIDHHHVNPKYRGRGLATTVAVTATRGSSNPTIPHCLWSHLRRDSARSSQSIDESARSPITLVLWSMRPRSLLLAAF